MMHPIIQKKFIMLPDHRSKAVDIGVILKSIANEWISVILLVREFNRRNCAYVSSRRQRQEDRA